ncbi:MAG: DUF2442 domain-containing protein [Acidobacteriota bacterium]|nr:DUF2442 domain-containing protein [Acidobacteriota bacterium]
MKSLGPLVCVEAVEVLEGYNVRLTFQDQTQKEVDLAPFLWGPIFEPIRNNMAIFRSVKVIGDTIGWDNGADIDPDVLYYDLTPAWMEVEEMAAAGD